MTRFWDIQNRKVGKTNNLKVFRNNKTKGPKHDSQNWLRSSKFGGGGQENLGFDQ